MRIVNGRMDNWLVEIDRSLIGRDSENKATKLLIMTDVEPCAYTLDIALDGKKYQQVMAVGDNHIEYTFPASLMVVGRMIMQIVGTFEDGKVRKSNLFGGTISESINATETVPEETATDFQQALAAYAEKLTQALGAAQEATEAAQSASDSAADAEAALDELAEKIASGEFKGEKGDKGDRGEKGEQGERGEKGETGADGRDGINGRDGVDGKDGAPGRDGVDGRNGSDATVTKEAIDTALGIDAKESIGQLSESITEISKEVESKANSSEVYSKTESDAKFLTEHQDVSSFITKAVSDLANYYTKSNTYTKSEVNNLVSAIPKFKILPVDALPTSNISDSTIYLLKTSETETGNLYTEYIRVGDKWEKLGTQTLDLSGYALKSEVPNKTSDLENDTTFICNYGQTDMFEKFKEAYNNGVNTYICKLVEGTPVKNEYYLFSSNIVYEKSMNLYVIRFACVVNGTSLRVVIWQRTNGKDVWTNTSESLLSAKTVKTTLNQSNAEVPTSKAVYDFLTDNTTPFTDEEKAKIRTRLGL